jgi:hypothetical protein
VDLVIQPCDQAQHSLQWCLQCLRQRLKEASHKDHHTPPPHLACHSRHTLLGRSFSLTTTELQRRAPPPPGAPHHHHHHHHPILAHPLPICAAAYTHV